MSHDRHRRLESSDQQKTWLSKIHVEPLPECIRSSLRKDRRRWELITSECPVSWLGTLPAKDLEGKKHKFCSGTVRSMENKLYQFLGFHVVGNEPDGPDSDFLQIALLEWRLMLIQKISVFLKTSETNSDQTERSGRLERVVKGCARIAANTSSCHIILYLIKALKEKTYGFYDFSMEFVFKILLLLFIFYLQQYNK